DRGVSFLRKAQRGEGYWGDARPEEHRVGMAALPGLTLLECGAPANDPVVRRAAEYVRAAAPDLSHTYSISLAILFLDRLGDPADRPLIQTLALRLVAGQTSCGGWTYHCPVLKSGPERDLLTALEKTRPRGPQDLFLRGPGGKPPEWLIATKK